MVYSKLYCFSCFFPSSVIALCKRSVLEDSLAADVETRYSLLAEWAVSAIIWAASSVRRSTAEGECGSFWYSKTTHDIYDCFFPSCSVCYWNQWTIKGGFIVEENDVSNVIITGFTFCAPLSDRYERRLPRFSELH